eukprot:c23641_g1_i1 orf=344-2101(-)
MKARELELCEIQRWYPRFKSLSLKTIIHPLPESFIAYLQEDGLFLPRDSEALPARAHSTIADCDEDDYHRWDEEDDETSEPEAPSFPQLEAEVAASIAKLDGSVFPKLNWSAPKDSAWISSNGNLRCTNFAEICLLLKSSDSLVHDLSHAYDSCDDKTSHRPHQFFLALRKWYDMRPEMEFRGFVRHGLLVGVSQREVTGFYPALLESQDTLDASVFGFFIDSLSEVFELEDYTFDCYVTRAGKVKLVDFNPWGAFTLPLLFTWEELEDTYAKFEAAFSETCVMSLNGDGTLYNGSCNACEDSSSDGVGSSHDGGVSSIEGEKERCAGSSHDGGLSSIEGDRERCAGSSYYGGVSYIKGDRERCASYCFNSNESSHGGGSNLGGDVESFEDGVKGVTNRNKDGHVIPVVGFVDNNKDGMKGVADGSKDGVVNPVDSVINIEEERARPCPVVESPNGGDAISDAVFRSQDDGSVNPIEGVVNPAKERQVVELVDSPGDVDLTTCSKKDSILLTQNRKKANIVLREQGFKSDFRIVKSNCHVQVNLRMGGGVPYDYVQTGPGSAWDEFFRRASEEVQQQNKDAAAGG